MGNDWREKNRDKYLEYQREYYKKNKEKIKPRKKQWFKDNREKWNEYQLERYYKRKGVDKMN